MKSIKKYILGISISLALSFQANADCSYELFSVSSTKGTKIIDFIDQLSDQCKFSLIVTDVNAQKFLNTSLNKTHIKNLTINEVLGIILKENNLFYTLENNLLKISYLTTKVFNIDYILSQRIATGSTNVTLSSSSRQSQKGGASSGGAGGGGANNNQGSSSKSGIKIESNDEVEFWKELDLELQKVLNRPEDVYVADEPIINKNAGLITVTATQRQMSRLDSYLKKLQDKVQLQVLIDVQLLSVTMSEGKTTGVDWQQLYALQNISIDIHDLRYKNVSEFTTGDDDTSITEATYNGFRDVANLVSIKSSGSINEVIKFLKTQGDVTSISNPKVLTLNNQPALITAGTEFFYKVKSSTNQQGSGGGVASTTQNESIQSVFAGVLLSITPEISDDKTITLKINPSLSETANDMSQTTSAERSMPPDLNRRQLSSVVTIQDGNRIILGGLISTKNTKSSNKIPILGDIPILNYLFKYESNSKQVQELVIVIETHIIKKNNNSLSLSDLGYSSISEDTIQSKKSLISVNTDTSAKNSNSNKIQLENEI
ncbi:MAG: pilus (MSHA type) biogenesis protein MshL [Sulfurimonas sp.]|nr:pilus (MSHA type) biogenesis protein MshL [Sulfurimonas sp.]